MRVKAIDFTMALVGKFFHETGSQTFSYDRLRRFYYGSADIPKLHDWHSIERQLRELARRGCLQRHYLQGRNGGKQVYFVINLAWARVLQMKAAQILSVPTDNLRLSPTSNPSPHNRASTTRGRKIFAPMLRATSQDPRIPYKSLAGKTASVIATGKEVKV